MRIALEPCHVVRIARQRRGQDLQRDFPLELRVPRAVHLAHPARAERREDLLWAETVSSFISAWEFK